METKEIDVYFIYSKKTDAIYFASEDEDIARDDLSSDEVIIKKRVAIEIPEKKIEITESEFDIIYNKHLRHHGIFKTTKESLKKELGF